MVVRPWLVINVLLKVTDKRYKRQSINANKFIQLSIKIWLSMLTINILTKILDKRYNANKILFIYSYKVKPH
jgi:hypothetical protein